MLIFDYHSGNRDTHHPSNEKVHVENQMMPTEYRDFCELHDCGILDGIGAIRGFEPEPIPTPEEIVRTDAEEIFLYERYEQRSEHVE